MSITNDPRMSESLKRHISELSGKKQILNQLKKDIKNNPDERYLERKEVGKEVKELEALVCEEMDDGDEVQIGRRRFKKQRCENTRYTKDRIHEFFEAQSIDPEVYNQDNKEEQVALKAVGKTK